MLLKSYSVPPEAIYEDIISALKGHYGNHQVAVAYRMHLKARKQLTSASQQEFTAAFQQLADRSFLNHLQS
jgi:ABC-type transporter MlaC component